MQAFKLRKMTRQMKKVIGQSEYIITDSLYMVSTFKISLTKEMRLIFLKKYKTEALCYLFNHYYQVGEYRYFSKKQLDFLLKDAEKETEAGREIVVGQWRHLRDKDSVIEGFKTPLQRLEELDAEKKRLENALEMVEESSKYYRNLL